MTCEGISCCKEEERFTVVGAFFLPPKFPIHIIFHIYLCRVSEPR